jgi:ribosomal protein L37E
MDDERAARNGAGQTPFDPDAERPPWLRQLLRSRRASQAPANPNVGSSPSGRLPAVGRAFPQGAPPGRLPGAPSSGVLGRPQSAANLGWRRDIAAEQTAMVDIARPDLVACPRCGAANFDNVPRCAECGYVLLITCPRCSLVSRVGAMQCARCGLPLSIPTGAPRTGAYGVAASSPLLPLSGPLPPAPLAASSQRPYGRWILTTVVTLVLFCALVVVLAEAWQPGNDAIASMTHLDIHSTVSRFIDWLFGLLPH